MTKLLLFLFSLITLCAAAQKNSSANAAGAPVFNALKYRLVGPFRGGRSAAVAGSYKDRNTFYFGATGGGVWKTTDGGNAWKNISDKYFGGSIGAVAVALSDEAVIYVGEGENTLRGNVSEGLGGMWRSADGGRTWKNIGLKEGRHIIRIVVHPRDPNTVWVGVLGHLFGPNEERGVYKTIDGGKTWKRTLFVNEQTGISDLVMEPNNPDVWYAGTWRVLRTPYSLESGGEGGGLWKSTDGGETWKSIKNAKGLPKGVWGIVGVAIAPSNGDKIYAMIENAGGGLFASADGGETWTLTSADNNIRQRAWYYTKVFVDPKNENLVYAPNVGFMRSRDGGKTFQSVPTPHSDHHDLWIDPQDGSRMIVADDGGAQVSFNGGESWSTYMNQPTAQLYRLSTDNAFPYRILAAQQDNTTLRIRHRSRGAAITEKDWEETAGSESGYVVADPLNPDVVYGGNYGGYLSRLDHKTGENRAVSVWPDNPMGAGADVLKYRFQWNFPIFFSPHNPKRLYAAGNHLFASDDEGGSWTELSPDLTTNDKTKQGPSGGPITKDNTSVEYYSTIFTAMESPYEKDLLWTGSDDGLIHISRDGGKSWNNVTPSGIPKWMMWNSLDADPFRKDALYAVGTRYKLDDYTPYIYKTEDYGKTWKLLTNGIDRMHFTRVARADPKRPGLLYAGTEFGMYISFNDGASWQPFQLNLPVTPITDLHIKENDLIVGTQGRSIWILDDLGVLQQMSAATTSKNLHVFGPKETYRVAVPLFAQNFGTPPNSGTNPPAGAVFHYYIREAPDTLKASVSILDKESKWIKTFSTDAKEDKDKLAVRNGLNQFAWNLRYPEAEKIEGMILWNGTPGAIVAPPGNYTARFRAGKDSMDVPFVVKADPNYKTTSTEYEEQFNFLWTVREKFNETQKAIKDIRALRSQITQFTDRAAKDSTAKPVKIMGDSLVQKLTAIEETLYQTKAKSMQDVLNYPIRLNDKLAGVFNAANSGNFKPSKQVKDVYASLAAQADTALAKLHAIKKEDLPEFNALIRKLIVPVIGVEE